MEEYIIAKGKIFELVQTKQPDGRVFEVARRAPGVRTSDLLNPARNCTHRTTRCELTVQKFCSLKTYRQTAK